MTRYIFCFSSKACFIPGVMADKRALERDQTNGMFRARQLSKIAHLAMFPNSCSTLEILAFDSRNEERPCPFMVVLQTYTVSVRAAT